MPRTRNPSMDGLALRLLRLAANKRDWTTFRVSSSYEERLTLQRAIFYLRSDQVSVQVEWLSPAGTWARLLTPRGTSAHGPRTQGTPVGRLRVNTKAAGRAAAQKAIREGIAAYDTLT